MDTELYPNVSIVIIGYNEAENLPKTFQAISQMHYPPTKLETIYVDSGSKDNSVEIARQYVDKVFIEAKYPTPGRNRNRGLIEAKYEIVHFIDGDVTINKDYLRNIVFLFAEKNVQAIVGQLNEQYPNIYNRMASLSQATKKEGYTTFTATGATYLKKALLSVNGYDERIRRGQETDLGERFRDAGYKIWRTAYKMGSHNFDIRNLWQYLEKYEINASSMLQLAGLKGGSSYVRSAKSKIAKQIIKLILFFTVSAISLIFNNVAFILLYLLLFWFLRNKETLTKGFLHSPGLYILRLLIDFFFYWKWWLGFFKEFLGIIFYRSKREFFLLEKDVLTNKCINN
jgi:glycosyltransferase involved in cell wall biosynthesis